VAVDTHDQPRSPCPGRERETCRSSCQPAGSEQAALAVRSDRCRPPASVKDHDVAQVASTNLYLWLLHDLSQAVTVVADRPRRRPGISHGRGHRFRTSHANWHSRPLKEPVSRTPLWCLVTNAGSNLPTLSRVRPTRHLQTAEHAAARVRTQSKRAGRRDQHVQRHSVKHETITARASQAMLVQCPPASVRWLEPAGRASSLPQVRCCAGIGA
jgi:hypothetical protein